MGIYARGKFWWKYYDKDPQTGRSPLKPASTKILVDAPTPQQRKQNKIDAEAQYQDDLTRLREGVRGGVKAYPPITFEAFCLWCLKTTLRKNTSAFASTLRTLASGLGPQRLLASITDKVVIDWIAMRSQQVKAGSVITELAILKAILRRAVGTHLAAYPLSMKVASPKGDDFEARHFEHEEFERFIAAIQSTSAICDTPRAEGVAIAYAAVDTLLRRGSLLRLTWRLDKGSYFLPLNAKVKIKDSAITARLRRALDALPRTDPQAHIFASHYEHSLSGTVCQLSAANHLEYWFRAVCERANVPYGREIGGVTFHSFRHTGATWLFENNANEKDVMEIGGWKTLAQVQRYCHSTIERRRALVESLGNPKIAVMRPRAEAARA